MNWQRIYIYILFGVSTIWAQTDNQEFRATWVITWEHISAGSSVSENQARIRTILDNHVAANMNAVLFQVRQGGTAYYNSSFEPWGYYAGGSDPGYDPLQYAIEQAHARGLELHAWFNTFQTSSVDSTLSPLPPALAHPDWVCRDGDGNPMPGYRALSPGLQAVRDYTLDVAMELVTNYDIDGLHLDYVRWNEYDTGDFSTITQLSEESQLQILDGMVEKEYNAAARSVDPARYTYDIEHSYLGGIPSEYDSWEEFWRSSVTEFVHALHDSIQTQKPWVRLSVAAIGKYKAGGTGGWNGYYAVFQDAALWFNEGYIDQLTPMHYHWTTSGGFTNELSNDWGLYIQPGVNAGRLYSAGPGSYQFALNNVWSRHESVINACRSIDWVDGFQFFSYGSWQGYQYWPIAGATFFSGKTKIRDTGIYVNESPVSPSVSLAIIDDFTFDITVTPDESVTEDQWWAIYRSETDEFDVDESKIIGVLFGADTFTITESFDGTQDHNSSYFYSATMLDRYWNESLPAVGVESSVLESFAPVALYVYPEPDDTVNVNTPLTFNFSKSMNIVSVESALSFSPDIGVDIYSWSESNHRLTVYPLNNLDFLTAYTVSLSDVAQDINGVAFDGDADGVAGGTLSYTFLTKEIDEAGPRVIYSTPDFTIAAEDFDVEGVISFVFDEELDRESVTMDAISFSQAGEEQEFGFLMTGYYGKSVLDIKLFEPLHAASDYTITLAESISDTIGNPLDEVISVSFTTFNEHYSEIIDIDNFTAMNGWWDPEGSGSTAGTIGSATTFGYSTSNYLPASSIYNQGLKSAYIAYQWDTTVSSHLLREYIPDTAPPASVYFDTSYNIQCYIYGDASNNKFRFAIDEGDGSSWITSEVSTWYTIDWEGWRLLEWDLSDPSMVGTWLTGSGVLDGTNYRADSFQLTYDPEFGEVSGRVYLDNFRIIKRMPGVSVNEESFQQPTAFRLNQNYPNPFNPETMLSFSIPDPMQVRLSIFDIRGRELEQLINDRLTEGEHKIRFSGSDYATGVYIVVLETKLGIQGRRILLLK
ncbi:MAG: family 10 glycosylhydrolase [Candidatus Marinimicrobia bacterium]|nr:family 10 glycosylhydrolase [Candidatus Neomarinimicrobiota bacterium]